MSYATTSATRRSTSALPRIDPTSPYPINAIVRNARSAMVQRSIRGAHRGGAREVA
jgi:hypothetical protein